MQVVHLVPRIVVPFVSVAKIRSFLEARSQSIPVEQTLGLPGLAMILVVNLAMVLALLRMDDVMTIVQEQNSWVMGSHLKLEELLHFGDDQSLV